VFLLVPVLFALMGQAVLPSAVPPSPDSLSLEVAIQVALERNAQVAASQRELEAAEGRRQAAAAIRYPFLSLSGFTSRYTSGQRLLPPNAPGQPLVYTEQAGGADLAMDVPLFLGGRLTERLRAAEKGRDVYAQRLEWTGAELEYQVASTFFAILRQERVVRSVRFSAGALEAHERTLTEMMEAGKAARVDVLRTQVRLADLRHRLLVEENALQVQRKVLAYLMGEDGSEALPPLRGTLDLAPFQEDTVAGLAQALSRRPDLEAVRAARSAQEHRVGAARAARWPALHLRGSFTERWAIAPLSRPEGADASPSLGSIGLVLSLPLFDGGLVSAQIAEERALMAAAEERVRDTEALARLQVEEAVLGVRSGRGRVEATETSIQQAQETLRIEREKYRLGKGSITDVLDAQSELLAAETAYYGALAEYNTAIARYRLVTGERASWKPQP
jgi:outer membrane protein